MPIINLLDTNVDVFNFYFNKLITFENAKKL